MDNYALVSTFSDLDENKYLKDFCDYQSISIDRFFEFNDYSNMIKKISFGKPVIDNKELSAVKKVLRIIVFSSASII